MDGPPEVGDLERLAACEEQVFRLDVAVDHVLAVAVLESPRQLLHQVGGLRLGEAGWTRGKRQTTNE